jgi:DUF1680 family protein
VNLAARPGQYETLRRAWSAGDEAVLALPMEPRLVEANPLVEQARNQVAVMRGPLVYCLESADLPEGVRLDEIHLAPEARLEPRPGAGVLEGVLVLAARARRLPAPDWGATLYRPLASAAPEPVEVRLIPYFAWANRGVGEMSVWLPLAR